MCNKKFNKRFSEHDILLLYLFCFASFEENMFGLFTQEIIFRELTKLQNSIMKIVILVKTKLVILFNIQNKQYNIHKKKCEQKINTMT